MLQCAVGLIDGYYCLDVEATRFFCVSQIERHYGDINRCDDIVNLSGGARSEETVAGASDATEGAASHRQVGGQRLR